MGDDFDTFSAKAEAAERPLIDAAWAQFEGLTGRHQASAAGGLRTPNIPGYRLLREIHRGGQGVVYQAAQESTRRKMAVKILKGGPFADPIELARFDREVDVLSRLNHPNIVAIHDRGSTGAGYAYYVMDYIPGKALDVHVSGADLSIREVLTLFLKICEAVNIAHLRGIIHRDLKPSNVRVDDEGEPHVLDFGLAKLAQDGDPGGGMTVTGQFLGSLPWASPEQAEGRSDLLDIRTDVYSLGVMLYQLVTRSFPYPVSGSMNDVVRSIVYASPARPTTITRGLDRDVEVILLKCLEKQPERRYQSAGELARDIQRYLNREPIEARPASSLYQLRQFARRNKTAIVGAAALLIVLVLGSIGSTVGLIRATKAEQLAVKRWGESQRAASKAETVSNFLQEMLSSVDPAKAMGREVTIRLALDEAAARIEGGSLREQPGVEADLRSAIGTAYLSLGHYAQAEHHLRSALAMHRSLGDMDSSVARDLSNLADLLGSQGKYDEEEDCLREALAIQRRLHTGDHRELAGAEQGLAACLRAQGKLAEAEPHYLAALEMRRRLFGPEHEDVAQSLNSLALLQQNKGELAAAESLFREALAMRRKILGDPHPVVADALNNLANLLHLRGDLDQPESLLREALEMRRKLLGPEHPGVAQSAHNLASVLIDKRDYVAAEGMYREALAIWQKTLPGNHPNLAMAQDGLGCALLNQKFYAEAESALRVSLAIGQEIQPANDYLRLRSLSMLGEALTGQGRYEEAESVLTKAYHELKSTAQSRRRQETLNRLVRLYELWGRPEDAARWRAEF